ncbi:MAG: AAA family ATPase [Ectothiorhodospiraceae bacterium AqS1]|nr:AAA family ATPase [Ectothiorhodospiraceae bacterium AqS1]
MRNVPSPENLTLKVEDFGPIIEAEIDLRPLTVFAGPSNTGKSWLAMLIYALHKHFESVCNDRTGFFITKLEKDGISEKETNALIDWARSEIFSKKKSDIGEIKQRIELPDFIMKNIHESINESNESIIHQICRAIGVEDEKHLIRNSKKCHHTSISIMKTIDDRESLHQRYVLKGDEFTSQTLEFPNTPSIDIDDLKSIFSITRRTENLDPDNFDLRWKLVEPLSAIASRCISPWFEPLSQSAYYFPADRTNMMRTYRSIVSAIVGNTASAGPSSIVESTAHFSGIMADFLRHLINIVSPSDYNKKSHPHHIMEYHGAEIEENIARGSIEVKASPLIGYPEFRYRPKGWKRSLPLLSASSMVSELAPIALFLRHKVMKGNTLIIEEPEGHLHPKIQVELIQQIAALVQSGVRVILTTHSDWILQTLGNIICASAMTDKARSHIPSAKIALKSEQVGVWLFKQKKSPKGSVVKEMILDWESGLYDSDYDVVSEDLYRDNALIYNNLMRARHDEQEHRLDRQ